MANASPQSPVPGSLGREQSKHLLANIELGWAPLGVVRYIITRADSFIGASVYPAQVTTPIVLTPARSLELQTKAIRRFAKVSIVSYSRPSLMIILSASQFHVYLPRG